MKERCFRVSALFIVCVGGFLTGFLADPLFSEKVIEVAKEKVTEEAAVKGVSEIVSEKEGKLFAKTAAEIMYLLKEYFPPKVEDMSDSQRAHALKLISSLPYMYRSKIKDLQKMYEALLALELRSTILASTELDFQISALENVLRKGNFDTEKDKEEYVTSIANLYQQVKMGNDKEATNVLRKIKIHEIAEDALDLVKSDSSVSAQSGYVCNSIMTDITQNLSVYNLGNAVEISAKQGVSSFDEESKHLISKATLHLAHALSQAINSNVPDLDFMNKIALILTDLKKGGGLANNAHLEEACFVVTNMTNLMTSCYEKGKREALTACQDMMQKEATAAPKVVAPTPPPVVAPPVAAPIRRTVSRSSRSRKSTSRTAAARAKRASRL